MGPHSWGIGHLSDPEKNGAAEGTRTPDPIITNDVLYQLSYSGILLRLLSEASDALASPPPKVKA
jgi:hypothetical protein